MSFERSGRVRLRAGQRDSGVVIGVREHDGRETEYEVFFSATKSGWYPERSLEAADAERDGGRPRDAAEQLVEWQVESPERFRSFLTLAKLDRPLSNNLYSFVASRTERLPYQFKPVLK